MFLLGFISKRVINYTSKYNDDDEGYDDIIYYWIYIHTYVYIHVHTIPIVVCDLAELSKSSSSVYPSKKKARKHTWSSYVHYRKEIRNPIFVLIINLNKYLHRFPPIFYINIICKTKIHLIQNYKTINFWAVVHIPIYECIYVCNLSRAHKSTVLQHKRTEWLLLSIYLALSLIPKIWILLLTATFRAR